MNKLITKNIYTLLSMFCFMACDDYLGGDTNLDPNRVNEVSLDALLPSVIAATSRGQYQVGFTISQISQHTASYFASGADIHEITRLNLAWTDLYLRSMSNADQLKLLAQEQESPHYEGIANVMLALNLGTATDLWENVPFDEAFQGSDNLLPNYQSQEEIYTTIQSLLDEAIVNLNETNSLFSPESDDLIYGGNLDQWIKTAYALKARNFIHLANVGNSFLNDALQAAENAFDGNEDDFELQYTDRNLNPWHAEIGLAIETGNFLIAHSAQLVNTMNGTNYPVFDPRLPIIADPGTDTEFIGMVNGSGGGNTTDLTIETWYTSSEAPLLMVTYAEVKFIEAEAAFLTNGGNSTSVGSTQQAYDAYLAGIQAHMEKLGVPEAEIGAYLSDPSVAVGTAGLTLELIMKEKWIALFLNPEAWTDLRRYNYSNDVYRDFSLPENHNPDLSGQFIQRASYPFDELSRNSGETEENTKDIAARMWRDQ